MAVVDDFMRFTAQNPPVVQVMAGIPPIGGDPQITNGTDFFLKGVMVAYTTPLDILFEIGVASPEWEVIGFTKDPTANIYRQTIPQNTVQLMIINQSPITIDFTFRMIGSGITSDPGMRISPPW